MAKMRSIGTSRVLKIVAVAIVVVAFLAFVISALIDGAVGVIIGATASATLSVGVAFFLTEVLLRPFYARDINDAFLLSRDLDSTNLERICKWIDIDVAQYLSKGANVEMAGSLVSASELFPRMAEALARVPAAVSVYVEFGRLSKDGIFFRDVWQKHGLNKTSAKLSITPALDSPTSTYIATETHMLIVVNQPDGGADNPLVLIFKLTPRADHVAAARRRLGLVAERGEQPIWFSPEEEGK